MAGFGTDGNDSFVFFLHRMPRAVACSSAVPSKSCITTEQEKYEYFLPSKPSQSCGAEHGH